MRCAEILMAATLGLSLFACHLQAGEPALADPTRPSNTGWQKQRQTHSGGNYTLNSTLVSSSRRVAVINGQNVSEGETVGDATVIQIGKYDVLLQSPNRQIKLKLLPDIVKNQ